MGGNASKPKKPTNMTGHPAERPSKIFRDDVHEVYRTTVCGEAAGSASERTSQEDRREAAIAVTVEEKAVLRRRKGKEEASPWQAVEEKAVLQRGEAGRESTKKAYQLVQTYLQRGSSGEAANETESSLTDLLPELIEGWVVQYLSPTDAANLGFTNRFFSHRPRISHPLLMHVALGRQTAAEEMIKKDLALICCRRKIDRGFINIYPGKSI